MIFVTVGTQLPFERLVGTVDKWAGRTGRHDVFAQIGPSERQPQHVDFRRFLDPEEFMQRFEAAELVIAHAGMGTILTAMSQAKPILVMPRRAEFGEQRNDHQLATARRFKQTKSVVVAMDEVELVAQLDCLEALEAAARIGPYASPELLSALGRFVAGEGSTT